MSSLADGLPSRFPIGTRYVVEGRGGATDAFASVCDIWSFPMADTSNCRPIWRTGRARAAGAFLGAARLENNFRRRNRGDARALKDSAGWSAPQPPTPHPSGDRPWPLLAPGSSFVGRCGKRQWAWNPDAPLAIECVGALPNAGWRRRRVGGPLPSGRNPARFLYPDPRVPRPRAESRHDLSGVIAGAGLCAKPGPPPDHPGAPSRRGRRIRGLRECRPTGDL